MTRNHSEIKGLIILIQHFAKRNKFRHFKNLNYFKIWTENILTQIRSGLKRVFNPKNSGFNEKLPPYFQINVDLKSQRKKLIKGNMKI